MREVLGEEYSLSPDQLNRYRMYARSLKKMAVAVPELYTKVMNSSIILSVKPTIKYAKLSVSDMQELVPQILDKPFDLSRIIRGIPVTERLPRGRPKSKQVYIPPAPITVVMKHDSKVHCGTYFENLLKSFSLFFCEFASLFLAFFHQIWYNNDSENV